MARLDRVTAIAFDVMSESGHTDHYLLRYVEGTFICESCDRVCVEGWDGEVTTCTPCTLAFAATGANLVITSQVRA